MILEKNKTTGMGRNPVSLNDDKSGNYPLFKTFLDRELKMSVKEFSVFSKIGTQTIWMWNQPNRRVPPYVFKMLELMISAEKLPETIPWRVTGENKDFLAVFPIVGFSVATFSELSQLKYPTIRSWSQRKVPGYAFVMLWLVDKDLKMKRTLNNI